jgi:hypothetical protein
MEDDDLSPSEQRYRYKLIQLAQCIVDEYGEMEAPEASQPSRAVPRGPLPPVSTHLQRYHHVALLIAMDGCTRFGRPEP